MIETGELVIHSVASVCGHGEGLSELAVKCAKALDMDGVGGVIAADFSNPERFPALAVKVAAELGLPSSVPAFDLQLACSAYPYALYLAGKFAADTGKRVLVIDGDVQSPFVDKNDKVTNSIFSDACTATVISVNASGKSLFDFLTRYDESLICTAEGPIKMDGFKVFEFVATEIAKFLSPFGKNFDMFVPHQANPYMIRRLAEEIGLENKLLTLDENLKNPGSCSVAMTLASKGVSGRALIAGFGAGFSAVAGTVNVAKDFKGIVL